MIDFSGWRKRQIMAEDDNDIQDYKKPWVGLTDEEVMVLNRQSYDAQIGLLPLTFYRAIEAKLKEKNT
tara:strand:+ start:3491 stop:3694 length:204 start_codon:yes stop_codon:yes gene_type:complete